MKELRNNLKQIRTRQGMSQQDLAALAGVTRQTISGVESDLYAPSAMVALKIARALGCRVEDLFWLDDDMPDVTARPAGDFPPEGRVRLMAARVGGQWVAHPLAGPEAFRSELIPADGEGELTADGSVRVRLLDDPASLGATVIVAGCSPALSLWCQAAQRWHPGLRAHWIFANSMAGLERLKRCEVHAAGVHLYDPASGEYNLPFVRQVLPGQSVALINLGLWEEGLVVQPGNPKRLAAAADLAQAGVRLINRETGAGSRMLLDRLLADAGVPDGAVSGYADEAYGHVPVAQAVAAGRADCGVTTAAMASAYGLGFVPWQQVRYDMAVPRAYLEEAPVREFFGALSHRRVRLQLEALGGYDTSLTGEIVGTT